MILILCYPSRALRNFRVSVRIFSLQSSTLSRFIVIALRNVVCKLVSHSSLAIVLLIRHYMPRCAQRKRGSTLTLKPQQYQQLCRRASLSLLPAYFQWHLRSHFRFHQRPKRHLLRPSQQFRLPSLRPRSRSRALRRQPELRVCL